MPLFFRYLRMSRKVTSIASKVATLDDFPDRLGL